MNSKKSTILISTCFFVLITAVVIFSFLPNTHKSNSNNINKSLPNSLNREQGSFEKIELGSNEFVIASSIHPVLRPRAKASAKLIGTADGIVQPPNGIIGFNGMVVAKKYIVYQQGAVLMGVDISTGKAIQVKTLATFAPEQNSDAGVIRDDIYGLTVDDATSTITYVVRRAVLFDSPEPEGIPQRSSSAELWSFHYPDGIPQKISSFAPIPVISVVHDAPDSFDVPLKAYSYSSTYFLQYTDSVASYDPQTKKITELKSLNNSGFIRFSVSPNHQFAVLYTHRDTSTSTQVSIEAHAWFFDKSYNTTEIIIHPSVIIQSILWSPDSTIAMLVNDDAQICNIHTESKEATWTTLPNFPMTAVNTYGLVSDSEALIGTTDPNAPLDEVPTYDPNFLTKMVVWNFENGAQTEVGNYRTPAYVGNL